MKYTKAQQKAIDTLDKNLQIIACAGSGKTQVISQRVVNILKSESAVIPGNIVAFTYTEKAAAELKHRIVRMCKEQLGEIKGLAEMYVGTIHSWCLQVLQEHVFTYQKFSVLDEVKLKLFVDRHYHKTGMPELEMQRYKDTDYFIALMSIIRESEIANSAGLPGRLKQSLKLYEAQLSDSCYFDFTMIMSRTLQHLADDPDFRKKLQSSIKYLIVDEYQDVNPIQEKLIHEIYVLGANLCTVGDDDQTIYQWRGSDLKNILHFRQTYKNVEYIKLEDNFRSSEGVIQTALSVIQNNSRRLDKIMNTAGHQIFELGDLCYNQFESVEDENRFIVEKIQQLRGVAFKDKENSSPRGIDYSDCCILLRKWKKAENIVNALQEANIPFIVAGVNNLFEQPEVRAAHAIYLYLGKQIDAAVLKEYWLELSSKIVEKNLNKAILHLNTKFPDKLSYYESFNLQDILWTFLDKAGIREEKFNGESTEDIMGNSHQEIIFYNLGMYSQVIHDFELIHFKSRPNHKITNFLNFIKYSAYEYYPEGWLNNSFRTPNAVKIMTIYQAKGLEFPVVFLPGLNRNYLPSSKKGGLSVWHFLDKNLIEDQPRYEGSEEDERRLLYVALTRSQKFLILSRAPDGRMQQKESKFCSEIRQSSFISISENIDFTRRKRLNPNPKPGTNVIDLNFTILKSAFHCPWCFKFFCLYGYKEPLNSRIGYGLSIHNILHEIHRSSLEGKEIDFADIPELLTRHFHLPYAIADVAQAMKVKAKQCVNTYLEQNQTTLKDIIFAEKSIALDLGEGILVNGRMDLIKRKSNNGKTETSIIDFKSTEDSQTYEVSMQQLAIYALGYQQLTGEKADYLEIYNLDSGKPDTKKLLNEELESTRQLIINTANKIRNNQLDETCDTKNCVCRFKK